MPTQAPPSANDVRSMNREAVITFSSDPPWDPYQVLEGPADYLLPKVRDILNRSCALCFGVRVLLGQEPHPGGTFESAGVASGL